MSQLHEGGVKRSLKLIFSTMSRSSRASVGDAWRIQSFLERISGGECGVVTLVGSAPAHACDLGAAPQHLLQQLRRRHTCDHKLQDLRGATAERGTRRSPPAPVARSSFSCTIPSSQAPTSAGPAT